MGSPADAPSRALSRAVATSREAVRQCLSPSQDGAAAKQERNSSRTEGGSFGYRALLTQLAIVTGAPRTAALYFSALSAATSDETLETLGTRLANDARLTALTDWDVIRGALTTLEEFSREQGADVGKEMVVEMRELARITSRYSFLRR
jgi:hypothetical protein